MKKYIEPFIIKSYDTDETLLAIPIQLKREQEYNIPFDCFILKYGSLNISYDPGGKYLRYFHNPNNNEMDTIHFIKYKYHSVEKFTYLLSIKSSGIFRNIDRVRICFINSEIVVNSNGDVEQIIEDVTND